MIMSLAELSRSGIESLIKLFIKMRTIIESRLIDNLLNRELCSFQ